MARTIQSPGVEINEIDLSSRTVFPIGTNVHVQGFSANGPTDETLNVSTFSEFETIYGAPTNAAERYFYHTVKSAFNSPANIMVTRLPYGNKKGSGFTDELYSALVLPVSGDDHYHVGAGNSLTGSYLTDKVASETPDDDGAGTNKLGSVSDSTQLQFGVPIRVDLLPEEYQAIKNGEISFEENCIVPFTTAGVIDHTDTIFTGNDDPHANNACKFDDLPAYADGRDGLDMANYDENGKRKLSAFVNRAKYAGMLLVNKAQTTINTYFEGYYLAFGDNMQFAINDGTDNETNFYDALDGLKTFGEEGSYFNTPEARLNFKTTAHTVTGAQGSISEVFENIPSFDIANNENRDVIGLGVFKLRKSIYATDTTMLDFGLDESHVGSMDAYKQTANIKGGQPKSFYIETVDANSSLLTVFANKNISELAGTFLTDTENPSVPNTTISFHPEAQRYAWATGSYQEEVPASSKKSIGSIVEKVERNFEKLSNLDEWDIDITLDAGLSTINTYVQYIQEKKKYDYFEKWLAGSKWSTYQEAVDELGMSIYAATVSDDAATRAKVSGLEYPEDATINVAYDDELIIDTSGMFSSEIKNSTGPAADWIGLQGVETWTGQQVINSWKSVANSYIIFAQDRRKDHITILDPLRHIFVQGRNGVAMKDTTKNFSQHVFYPLKHLLGTVNTNYAACYGNWLKQYDTVTDKNVWMPPSGVISASYATNDSVYQPWFAPAGFTRGLITNALEVAIRPNQKQRDQFYKIGLNPIAYFPGDGYVIFGQKTLQSKPSAFDRINVRRMFLYLEKAVRKTIKYFVFEPNTFSTRQNILAVLTPIFQRVKSTQGCYDYLIVCDERNNPPVVIDSNELVVDIYIKPVRAAEFILVNFYATRTDQNFGELIG
jgi:hypothetical protein